MAYRDSLGGERETILTREMIPSVGDCYKYFGTQEGGFTPIELRPQSTSLWQSIPHGVWVIKTRNERVVGILDPGKTQMLPMEELIIITKQWTPYDTPIKECPTADNVYVQVDVLLVFRIVDPEKFEYILGGPQKLGEQLKALQEQELRHLTRSRKLNEVLDLINADESEMVARMNGMDVEEEDTDTKKSERYEQGLIFRYGVEVMDIVITDVKLPTHVMSSLQNARLAEFRKDVQAREAKHKKLVQDNKIELERAEEKFRIARDEAAAAADADRTEIKRQVKFIEDKAHQDVAAARTEAESAVLGIEAQTKRKTMELKAVADANYRELTEQGQSNVVKIESEAAAYVTEKLSSAHVTVAELNARATKFQAEAEAVIASQLKAKRADTLARSRNDVVGALAANKGVLLESSAGDNMVLQMIAAQAAATIVEQ